MEKITFLYLAIYPILPDYFRIAGVPSSTVAAILYVIAYLIIHKFRISYSKRTARFFLLVALMVVMPVMYHGEFKTVIKLFVECGIAPIILCDSINNNLSIEKILDLLTTVCLVTCFFGIFEFFTKTTLLTPLFNGSETDLSPALQIRGTFARAEATFGHAISYAIYLSACALIDSYFIVIGKKGCYKVKYVITVLTLLFTVSRAPIIIFIATQLLMLWLYNYRTAVKAILGATVVLLIVAGASFYLSEELFDNISGIVTMVLAVFSEKAAIKAGKFNNSDPFAYRFELLNVIPQYLRGNLLFGNGANLSFRFKMFGFTYYSIDNAYLSWIYRYGILGLVGNLCFLLKGLQVCFKNRKCKIYVLFFGVLLVFALNWCSVAQMFERKIFIVIFCLIYISALNDYKNNIEEI